MALTSYVGTEIGLNGSSGTFDAWRTKTNDIIGDLSTVVVTVSSSATVANDTNGSQTSGNMDIDGYLSASDVVVWGTIRGGSNYTWATSATLAIDSAVTANGNIDVTGDVTATTFIGSLTGNADTVTNGVYTTSNQTIAGVKTFSDNVGIKTTSPAGDLHIQGDAGNQVRLYLTDGDATGSSNSLLISKSGSASYVSDRQAGSSLWFGTADTERMRINSSGNVGIGTSLPSEKLHISAGADSSLLLGNANGVGVGYRLRANVTTTVDAGFNIEYNDGTDLYRVDHDGGSGFHAWYMGGSERMRIDSSGNVGIGTTSPTEKLYVSGNITATGDITASSFNGDGSSLTGINTDLVSDPAPQLGGTLTSNNNNIQMEDNDSIIFGTGGAVSDSRIYWNGSALKVDVNGGNLHIEMDGGSNTDIVTITSGGANKFLFDADKGNLTVSGNITAYGSPSDIRLKENIEPITNALDKVSQLGGYTFNYKKDPNRLTGVIAQEVEKVLPEAIYTSKGMNEDEEEHLVVRYGNMVGLLIEAIKELKAEIEELKKR